jgi:uncharacterized protein (UPF0179 family)
MIALVDKSSARVGYEFVYLGEADECPKCSLYIPCHHNLENGRKYRISALKNKSHICSVFDEVFVCEVDEVPIEVAMKGGSAFEGATVNYRSLSCKNTFCKYSSFCLPEGLMEGDRCTIVKIKDKIKCVELGELVLVIIRRI